MNTQLTPREREVIRMVADGSTNKQISSSIHISENTVKTHLRKLCCKLRLRNRVQLAYWVAKNNGDTEVAI